MIMWFLEGEVLVFLFIHDWGLAVTEKKVKSGGSLRHLELKAFRHAPSEQSAFAFVWTSYLSG